MKLSRLPPSPPPMKVVARPDPDWVGGVYRGRQMIPEGPGREGPKCGKNQHKTWANVGFPRARAPPIWEFPVPKLTQKLPQPSGRRPLQLDFLLEGAQRGALADW